MITAEEELDGYTQDGECIVVAYSHCCGSTQRTKAYIAHPEWQVFEGSCVNMGVCADDTNVTEAICAGAPDGTCTMVFP
jgi:hypothetical protein